MAMEKWKRVEGYEDSYEVSNLGRVRSTSREVKRGNHTMFKASKELSLNNNGKGYFQVHLYKDTKREVFLIHRLVAHHFIENKDPKKTEVNHIDEDKANNRTENLEWCTSKYNANYGTKSERTGDTRRKKNSCGKAVVGVNKETSENLYFKSMMDAQRAGFTYQTISNICTGVKGKNSRSVHKGYYWRYANKEDKYRN